MRKSLGDNTGSHAMRRRFTIIRTLLLGLSACSQTLPPSPTPPANAATSRVDLDKLIAALDTVQGEFRDVADLTFMFVSESRLLEEIAAQDERAVPKLVECLGRTRLARATAEHVGRVRVGVLCAEALVYTDFFQARNSTDRWPAGFQDSTAHNYGAGPEELYRAQRAWRAYLAHEPLAE
jgi:hypothetical protein